MNSENIDTGRFIKISDSLDETMRDELDLHRNKYPSIGGLLLVKNSKGDVLLRKNNLVVFRGRLFALEKIFGQPFNVPYNYIPGESQGNERGSNPTDINNLVPGINGDLTNLLNRRVCLFGIGSGGVSGESWFSPVVVPPSSIGLTNRIAFCDKSSDDYKNNPKFYPIIEEENKCYYKRLNTKDANDHFYPHWVFDTVTNTIAIMTTLHIDESYLSNPTDGNIKRINELALFMANESAPEYVELEKNTDYNIGNKIPYEVFTKQNNEYIPASGNYQDNVTYYLKKTNFSDIEMFSRITFDTESLYANKELVIEYYIFA